MQFIKQYWTLSHCQVEMTILNPSFNTIQLAMHRLLIVLHIYKFLGMIIGFK